MPDFWRSLDELDDNYSFEQLAGREIAPVIDEVGRRRFLQLMGASLALGGFTGCTMQPEERIVPYVHAPEALVPGKPLYFATTISQNGYGLGLLVESHDGRPTKIEGNPKHPATLGAANVWAQASVLDLYDPDRIQVVTNAGRVRTWETFLGFLGTEMEKLKLNNGEGLRILTGAVTSPTLAAQLEELLAVFPGARWHQYEAVTGDPAREGARLAFGQPVNTFYKLDAADLLVSLDADFLYWGPASLRYAGDFSARRRIHGGKNHSCRFYTIESSPTVTGTMADHKLVTTSTEVEHLALALAVQLGLEVSAPELTSESRGVWLEAVTTELKENQGRCVVIPGDFQTPLVHALAHWMNASLGNQGKTVIHTDPVEARPVNHVESLRDLVDDMNAGKVQTVVMLGGNPAYDAPVDLGFAGHLEKVPNSIHLSTHHNETSELCEWVIPESHYLEAWSDARAFDGTVSVVQPLIEPLYRSKSCTEVIAALLDRPLTSSYDMVREHWLERERPEDFDAWWEKTLHDGVMEGTAFPEKPLSPRSETLGKVASGMKERAQNGLEVIFRPDPSVFDGKYANNPWLQELPKTLTKLTWDNAAIICPRTAEALDVRNGDLVTLRLNERSIEAPVWLQPGHPANSVTVHLGYGRRKAGRIGEKLGFNAYAIRQADSMWIGSGLELERTGKEYQLVSTQDHDSMEGRDLVRIGTPEEFLDLDQEKDHGSSDHAGSDLYPGFSYEGYAWGMAVDLNACIGCNACVVACQAENSIPVVGKEEVARGREMHWIRIDRYYAGPVDNPDTLHQPVMCQHCENAPCESVCPVAATVHSDEGLNTMVYNRCVGTRYCSNNCPYKVRRFNFLLYSDWHTPSLKLQRNPDVTVRSRGVMEKCTYCLQRINEAKIQAKLEDRQVLDGEIQTACQQTCPSQAILFGNINDPTSRVAKLRDDRRNYGILSELKTVPRTTYLTKLKVTNEDLKI